MPLWSRTNFVAGFAVVLLGALGGAFVANDLTHALQHDAAGINSWPALLQRSAHGHFNLFGMLHILLGLTLPYSKLSRRLAPWLTLGLALGTVAIGPGMVVRSMVDPSGPYEGGLTLTIGAMLVAACVALGTHLLGLAAERGPSS